MTSATPILRQISPKLVPASAYDRRQFIRTWSVTDAARYDGRELPGRLDSSNTGSSVWADTAYRPAKNERDQVAALGEALGAEENRAEAADLLRALIDRIELTPNAEGKLEVDLYGDLAGILSLAGIWTRWTSARKLKEGQVTADLFGFLTTEPNAEVAALHPKAMPVILTKAEEWKTWLDPDGRRQRRCSDHCRTGRSVSWRAARSRTASP